MTSLIQSDGKIAEVSVEATFTENTPENETLSGEEEQFVAAFVDYWIRRGSAIMSSR
jgi:hypothetical protein